MYETRLTYLRRYLTNARWMAKHNVTLSRMAKLSGVGERWLWNAVNDETKSSCSNRVDCVIAHIDDLTDGSIEMPAELITFAGRPKKAVWQPKPKVKVIRKKAAKG